ncbi:uncharacterized protein LOC18431059 isoform X1 [Amborella trichopoda]|nr:uncharacterized protein LOC18431059 isoform X1 [Amborella trichopoda]|eukprot:XP_006841254.3 uncharacterized protein LOC18431059 isoform X1 [Amborella trichopoda]
MCLLGLNSMVDFPQQILSLSTCNRLSTSTMLLSHSTSFRSPLVSLHHNPNHHFHLTVHHSSSFTLSSKSFPIYPLLLSRFTPQNPTKTSISSHNGHDMEGPEVFRERNEEGKSFWGAVSLILGTAVGPGMLGLPSATIRSGPIPSTIAIFLSWVYVISSILLVAELSYALMEEEGLVEVSFTGLAINALGKNLGVLIAVVYASLNFSLLVACISGIGSLVSQRFPWIHYLTANALFPLLIGIIIGFFHFKVIDAANRLLCFIMLFSITSLVAVGLSVGRSSLVGSLAKASRYPSAILPAIPVTVLTLGFHVITPYVCKTVGASPYEARNAILFGGAVPLVMVLSWNLVVLGLAGTGISSNDPIKLLVSVNSSALPAVQGFAFSALATSLIGYALSFPQQLSDTLDLIRRFSRLNQPSYSSTERERNYQKPLSTEELEFDASVKGDDENLEGNLEREIISLSKLDKESKPDIKHSRNILMFSLVLGVPILIASFFSAAFATALDFAGVYANCFLFGVLPPLMAWIQRSRKKARYAESRNVELLPGGDGPLLLLFVIAVILGVWH